MANILVLHGPNLNLLGKREPPIYGVTTLAQIDAGLQAAAAAAGHVLECFQSNAEHELVERVQRTLDDPVAAIVINPAGLGHSSVVLRDALVAVDTPFIEVHLSNIHARESWRSRSLLADRASGIICGLGAQGYQLALTAVLAHLAGDAALNTPH